MVKVRMEENHGRTKILHATLSTYIPMHITKPHALSNILNSKGIYFIDFCKCLHLSAYQAVILFAAAVLYILPP